MCCKKELTDAVSIERGIGPVCWGHMLEDRRRRKNPYDPAGKSDYEYRIEKSGGVNCQHGAGGAPVLVITDLNRGGMSVTNNIEAVLRKIETDVDTDLYFLTLCGWKVIYRDSEGNYDGVELLATGDVSFYPLAAGRIVTSESEAIELARGGH